MIDGLVKIGGIIAVVNIWIVAKLMHRRCFERKLKKKFENGCGKNFKQIFSIENFNEALGQIEN